MNDQNDTSEILEIDFEVGHSSSIRSEVTTTHNPPRTHDWKIYVRSADVKGDLSCLIKRCVFHLHPEYPNHKRELKTTPFAIQESGYAGFRLPIEIYFKTKKEPKKFLIQYDLDLHKNIDGHHYRQKESYLRKYRCTFHNPDREFCQKILAAGGKIVDTGPIASNHSDNDANNMDDEPVLSQESITRHSPPQKRSISPSPTPHVASKKVKLEPSTNNTKKKQVQPVIKNENPSKTIVNIKKSKLVSCKSSSVAEEKISKVSTTKESNQSMSTGETIENPTISKPRPSKKLVKSQSTNDLKVSSQATTNNIKKKEPVSSLSKTKSLLNSQNVLKKPIAKNPQKTSIKTEQTSTLTVKSPSNSFIKQEPLSQPSTTTTISSNNTTTSASINNLKKIPKKTIPSSTVEKRVRSSMPASSLDRNSTRESQKQQPVLSKTKSNLKQDRPSLSMKNSSNNKGLEKITITKDRSASAASKRAVSNQSPVLPAKSSNHQPHQTSISPQYHNEPLINCTASSSSSPSINVSQPSQMSSPPFHVFQNEDTQTQSSIDTNRQDHVETDTQFSNKSNSFHEQTLIQSNTTTNQTCYSDQSDTNDSDTLQDDNNEEYDLPNSLTNDDLRYKLIYIYNRFQLNSINDLIIFVRFFKRHQLIDTSTLSMTKTPDEMFTYDLFLLSPSHIGELANDLGYTTTTTATNMSNSTE